MFINFWYVAGVASEITDQPLKRRMLGLDGLWHFDDVAVSQGPLGNRGVLGHPAGIPESHRRKFHTEIAPAALAVETLAAGHRGRHDDAVADGKVIHA